MSADGKMVAIRVHEFGPIGALVEESIAVPAPGPDEVLVRVCASGVGPWDAWIRSGKSVLDQPLPLTLGSDIAGIVEMVGSSVADHAPGDEVYGVTNPNFTGGYAEFALCRAAMIAPKPRSLDFVEAASVPVVAVTAWQMLFDEAKLAAGQTAIIQGAAGSVGSYAVMLAVAAGVRVTAVGREGQGDFLRELGAREILMSSDLASFEGEVDAAIDLVGGPSQLQLLDRVKRGGILVTAVPPAPTHEGMERGVDARFMLVNVTSAYLARLTEKFEAGKIRPFVGEVLPLTQARIAHEMLARVRPAKPGKIILVPERSARVIERGRPAKAVSEPN